MFATGDGAMMRLNDLATKTELGLRKLRVVLSSLEQAGLVRRDPEGWAFVRGFTDARARAAFWRRTRAASSTTAPEEIAGQHNILEADDEDP
jgi:DNA-binding GntR family transcriptional regulator